MAYFRAGTARATHEAQQITVAKTPLASFESNVSGLYLPEILAYFSATQAGSGDPSPSNPRAISGVTQIDTTVCGKNLFDKTNYASYAGYIQGGVIYSNPGHLIIYMPCLPNTTYTASRERTSANERFAIAWSEEIPDAGVHCTRTSQAPNSGTIGETMAVSTTTGSTAKYIVVWAWWQNSITQTARETLQLETGSTATAYEAYTGATVTTNLGGTYYGGYVNVPTGVMKVTHIYYNLADLTYTTTSWGAYRSTTLPDDLKYATPSEAMCDIYNFVTYAELNQQKPNNSFALASNYIYVLADTSPVGNICYKLLNPRTVQLTPAQIEQLLGQNNVFASTGDVAVKYWRID